MPIESHVVQIEGLDVVFKRLEGLKGKPLERRVSATLIKALRSEVVPAMKAEAPTSASGKRGPYPHAAGTLKHSIGVRALRKRTGELVALKVGPRTSKGNPATRAWYAWFAVRGTRPHIIAAAGLSRGSRSIRVANKGTGALALAFNGVAVKVVHHPGSKPNPGYIQAGRTRESAVGRELLAELVRLTPTTAPQGVDQ